MAAFWEYLKTALASGGMVVPTALTAEELAEVETLKAAKYDTWEWNFGRSPKYDLVNKNRFEGGGLEVRIAVEKGCIVDIVFYGDFLAISPLGELTAALKGRLFRRKDVTEVLDRFPIGELFGGITRDEVLDTIFYAGDLRTEDVEKAD